ncbi:hypothetical protein IAQ61_006673 [Plenodomus lingam]|uniref:2EXR domain-containing protein n=1 Tax=Leptosphaeria maculans (strain JN3 / isolate v23.1.3 / race Av1-4-5-6-7-8) TaxID=985895 RepID=E5AC84_LEPMJ|nr:hypothetical protein LEMA_P008730.1 [Plenodomus lingam JN3]KAH9869467.1 hypothetical protein IAQ61_006673 [Plenodomus lingam]CBY02086.1 hypothetical protein LEMA_P008730.1 [Plenodomus lingam JN3]
MPVYIIPRQQDPRSRHAAPMAPMPYRRNLADFPALPYAEPYLDTFDIWTPSEPPTWKSGNWIDGEPLSSQALVPQQEEKKVFTPTPTFHSFLLLPPELRLLIWAHTLDSPRRIYVQGCSPQAPNQFAYTFLPAAAFASKRTMEEAVTVLLENNAFAVNRISANEELRAFLSESPGRFALLRHLYFGFFDCFPQGLAVNRDVELAVACPGLRTLTVVFHVKHLTDLVIEDGVAARKARGAEELWERYLLQPLVECGRLERIVVELLGYYNEEAVEAVKGLREKLVKAFSEKGGRVVEVEYGWR